MKAEQFHKKDQARRNMRMAEIKMTMNEYKEAKEFLNSALKAVKEMEKEDGAKATD